MGDLQAIYALPGLKALHTEMEDGTSLFLSEMRKHQSTEEQTFSGWDKTLKISGGWLGGIVEPNPNVGGTESWRRPGAGLLQMISRHRCLEMVARAEGAAGDHYDWVIDSRLDIFWEHAHVPLELLSRDAIWIPAGLDWGGLNDRHAVIPRKGSPHLLDIYWGSLRFVAQGAVANFPDWFLQVLQGSDVAATGCDPKNDGNHVKQPCLNTENWLSLMLRAREVQVKRLPSVQWML